MFELLAILGALAWSAPIVVPWLYKRIIKPKLIIITHNVIEIGYTTFGPIVNINMSFLSENKEALIKAIKISLRHENNETHIFEWEWFEESLGQMDMGTTGIYSQTKNQKAVALRVKENDIVERKIGFQNSDFKIKYNDLINRTNEAQYRLQRADKDLSLIVDDVSYNDLQDHLKNSFFWNLGMYTIDVEIFLLGISERAKHSISFRLSNYDKVRLESNIEYCKNFIENSYVTLDPKYSEIWNWVYSYEVD